MKQQTGKKAKHFRPSGRTSGKHSVAFEYFDPAARVVAVAGDFNGWDPRARPLKRDAGGLWIGTVRLEPGSYQYKFVVDGERWEEDPLNLHRVPDGHGSFNSILRVGASPADDHGVGEGRGGHVE